MKILFKKADYRKWVCNGLIILRGKVTLWETKT